jgi:hypothetical protein
MNCLIKGKKCLTYEVVMGYHFDSPVLIGREPQALKELNYDHHHRHHLLYEGYLHLHISNRPCLYGIQCCNYSVVTVHGSYNTIIIIIFMQGMYTYIPETKHISMEYSVAAIL